MKSLLVIAALISGISAASAGTLKCTNAEGTLVYSHTSYNGGVHPAPGTEVSRDIWTFMGKEVFKQVTYMPSRCPPPSIDVIDEDLVTEFTGDKTVLSSTDGGYKREETYTQGAQIFRKSGGPILDGQGEKRMEDFMICHSLVFLYP